MNESHFKPITNARPMFSCFIYSGPYVSPWVTCNAIFQKAYETIVMQFLMFTYCDLHCHSILGFICLYSTLLYSPLNFVVFSFDGA